MKFSLYFFFLAMLFASCSADKMLSKGAYQDAFNVALKTVERKPNDAHHLEIAKNAHLKLQQQQEENISRLKEIDNTIAWEQIVFNLKQMEEREQRIFELPYPPKNLVKTNYQNRIRESELKAANLNFQEAELLMKEETTKAAQLAFDKYTKAKYWQNDFPEIDEKIQLAKKKGMVYILFQVENPNNIAFPQRSLEILQAIDVSRLDKNWLEFSGNYNPETPYEYIITLKILEIFVSADQSSNSSIEDTKEVKIGTKKVKNAQGKIVEEDVFKTIKADVAITTQSKTAKVVSTLNFTRSFNGDQIYTNHLVGNELFKHEYGTYKGDEDALSSKSKTIVASKKKSYPSGESMINDASRNLATNTLFMIRQNRKFFDANL